MTSLSDVQYEEIFSSAINKVMTEDFRSPSNSSDEEQIEVPQASNRLQNI
jgi:hypothetical protein